MDWSSLFGSGGGGGSGEQSSAASSAATYDQRVTNYSHGGDNTALLVVLGSLGVLFAIVWLIKR